MTTGLKGQLPSRSRDDCSVCSVIKAVRVINRKQPERATRPLERIHSDIWGPISIPERLGAIYFISFTDDFTCKAWIYLTKNRRILRAIFPQFRAERELEQYIKGYKI